MEKDNISTFDEFELNISSNIKTFLEEISKWSFILSIIGFVGIGLLVVIGFLFSTIMALMSDSNAYDLGYSAGVGFFYIIIALIYFFPILYLYKFSRKMKSALHSKNNDDFESAFANLKSHYKFVGILAIIIISLYVLLFLIGIVGASAL